MQCGCQSVFRVQAGESPITYIDRVTVMKELSRKFSADNDEPQNPSRRIISQPERYNRPVCHDLRFVVKESLNLGFRFFDEMDKMLQKFKEDEPENKPGKPENKEGEKETADPL
jgi:hypothetical protein